MNNYLEKLPQEVFNKIMLYNSHPVADLFKKELELDDYEVDNGSRFNTFFSTIQYGKDTPLKLNVTEEYGKKQS